MTESTQHIVAFADLPSLRLVGCRYQGTNQNNEIPTMWDKQFLPRLDELGIDMRQPFVMYGAEREPSDGSPNQFEYLAAVDVPVQQPIPEGMVAWDIPAHTWAVCKVAKLGDLPEVFGWMANTWLPQVATSWRVDSTPWLEVYPETYFQDETVLLHCPIVPV